MELHFAGERMLAQFYMFTGNWFANFTTIKWDKYWHYVQQFLWRINERYPVSKQHWYNPTPWLSYAQWMSPSMLYTDTNLCYIISLGKWFLNLKIHWNAFPYAQIWNKNVFRNCFMCMWRDNLIHRTDVFYKKSTHANKCQFWRIRS